MRSLILRVIRWPLYSWPRLGATALVAALVLVGLASLNNDPSTPVAEEQTASDGGGASDSGGSSGGIGASDNGGTSDGGGDNETDAVDRSDAEQVATAAVTGLVNRESPDSTEWKEATRPWVAADIVEQWEEAGWTAAETAPLTVDTVTFESSSDFGPDTSARWERVAVAHIINGDDLPVEHPFHVQLQKGDDGWVVTRLVSLEGVDE